MSDTPHPPILQEAADLLDLDGCTRIVELSASYDAGSEAMQKFVRLRPQSVQFVRLGEDGKTRRFTLSQQEVTAFMTAWQQYQLDYAEATAAEKFAQEQAREEAFTIAREIPAIHIHDDGEDCFWVEIEALKWISSGPPRQTGRELLAAVQAARTRWAEHILWLRESLDNPLERWDDSGAREQAAQAVEEYGHLIPFATDDSDDPDDHPF